MSGYAVQKNNDQMVSLLSSQFRQLYNPVHAWADAISMMLMFPQLRGLWPFSSATDSVFDVSGNGRTLTRNGSVSYSVDQLVPMAIFNGTDAYMSRADEAGLDITGGGAYVPTGLRGLTIGAWVNPDTVSTTQTAMGKGTTGGQLGYFLRCLSSAQAEILISVDGTATTTVQSTGLLVAGEWQFIVGRWEPSTELKIWLNDGTDSNTTSIPASIFNNTTAFQISGFGGTLSLFDGNIALPFLCASVVPDLWINTLYQMTAPLFKTSI